ncbi:hypoxanthine phosphoribosyltransferase [Balneicella halophila]|uniref:Hypoxanthine phosphoribosyltransferase n=1 Tax=Balneicella halophila TaxID=1537566 RepID=A0A7L4UPD7_BALHA|nr:hypoxanthine phosphoribosyltransferase [Balneicella halophila]PVX50995.1 hypoxanthine phosphoribosyltransferase [Balneicella halophila]
MKTVQVLDKRFKLSISEEDIQKRVNEIAQQMNKDLEGKSPLFVCILNGAFMFASDIFKQITVENSSITFFRLSSYVGTKSTGKIKLIMGFTEDLANRTVVILEDIVDTGVTIQNTIEQVKAHKPKEIYIATLVYKPEACKVPVNLDYVGFEIPNKFIVGYGLDYDLMGRNLPAIYTLAEDE